MDLRTSVSVLVVLLLSLSRPYTTHAQIAADRPGFGDGAATAGPGIGQAELGYAFNGNGGNSHELGQLLLRYGITNALELRGAVNSYVIHESPVDNGYTGTGVGAKLRLLQTPTSALSAVATLELPTETGAFNLRDDRARQTLKLAFDGALGTGLMLSVNGGASFYYAAGPQDDRAVEWLFVPTLSFGVTETTGAYVGYAGFYPDGPATNWVEGGLTFLQSTSTQFDVNAGLRGDDRSDAFFLGLGVAHRF